MIPDSRLASDGPPRPRVERLDAAVVAKIAAGEMISRPAAVVKELVENAIDAGAQRIDVSVGERPDRWLEVSDDGCGMDERDLLLALEPHATSKLRTEQDLLGVASLGFRGEAVPSIGRVSRLEIRTWDGIAASGSQVVVEGGRRTELAPVARPRGTTVRVEELFFNSPVRKRFLRSGASELRLMQRLIGALALAHPTLGFRLVQQERTILDLPSTGDLVVRVAQLYGAEVIEKLLELREETPRGTIRGYIGVPELARAGAQHQVHLVNRRWVTAPWMGAALRHGFGDLLAALRQPFAVIALECDPSRIDVNVHPTKREVRFLDESVLFGDLLRATRNALGALLPSWTLRSGDRGGARSAPPGGNFPSEEWTRPDRGAWPLLGEDRSSLPAAAPLDAPAAVAPAEEGARIEASRAAAPPDPQGLAPVWQLHSRYLLAQTRAGLLIVDQHAAHERILYEEALENLAERPAPTQLLLFPKVVSLETGEWEIFEPHAADLRRLGIEAEEFGAKTVLLRGVPSLWASDPEGFLRDVLGELSTRPTRNVEERRRQLAASFACRSAIKSGQRLGLEEMNFLIDRLFSMSLPHGDPHGRPTFITVSLDDLDRRFGRSH